MSGHRRVNRFLQALRSKWRSDKLIVDKDRRRVLHAARYAMLPLPINPCRHLLALEILFELLDIQVQLLGVALKKWANIWFFAPGSLVLIQQIVHFPKPSLQRGCLGSQRRIAPMLMRR